MHEKNAVGDGCISQPRLGQHLMGISHSSDDVGHLNISWDQLPQIQRPNAGQCMQHCADLPGGSSCNAAFLHSAGVCAFHLHAESGHPAGAFKACLLMLVLMQVCCNHEAAHLAACQSEISQAFNVHAPGKDLTDILSPVISTGFACCRT